MRDLGACVTNAPDDLVKIGWHDEGHWDDHASPVLRDQLKHSRSNETPRNLHVLVVLGLKLFRNQTSAWRLLPLRSLLARDEGVQGLVLLAARGAALEVRAKARDERVRVLPRRLELDVAIQLVEAHVTADFWLGGPELPAEHLLGVLALHQLVSSSTSRARPRSSR